MSSVVNGFAPSPLTKAKPNNSNTDTMHPRIGKSGTRKGEYLGYFDGCQRIRKDGNHWVTYALGSSAGKFHYVFACTLEELGNKLDSLAAKYQA